MRSPPIKAGTSARPQAERVTAELDTNGRALSRGPSEGGRSPPPMNLEWDWA